MEKYDLHKATDRERLADRLPLIDEINYSLPRADFIVALQLVADYLPTLVPREYSGRFFSIYNTAGTLFTLVQLGTWFAALRDCDGFSKFLTGFSNPTQFWDTYFEAQVAAFFKRSPGVTSLSFAPEVTVGTKRKYPEFVVSAGTASLLVECKQIRFTEAKASMKFRADCNEIQRAMDSKGWSHDYCIEVEFLGPERAMMRAVAEELVEKAKAIASAGGGTLNVGHLRAFIRHRDEPFRLNMPRKGLHFGSMRSPGYPVHLADPRHTPFRACRTDLERKYPKLFRAALADARTQLPRDRPSAVCVAGIPLRVIAEVIDPLMRASEYPPHIRLITAWDSNSVQLFAPDEAHSFVEQFLGPIDWNEGQTA